MIHRLRQNAASLGLVAPLVPALVLWAIGSLLNLDWWWYGGIASAVLAGYGMYFFGLWLAGAYLLPIESNRKSLTQARALLVRFGVGQKPLMAVVREGKVMPGPDGKPRQVGQGEGAIFVDSTSVVVLGNDTRPIRIIERGVHFTRKDEKIWAILDLRPQVRAQETVAQTRDGIWVKFRVSARFQIAGTSSEKVQNADPGAARPSAPYLWSPRQVAKALSHSRVGADPNQTEAWDDRVLNEAVKRVRTVLAGYTFDELTEPRSPQMNPRETMRNKLEEDLKAEFAGNGIKVLGIGLSQFVPRDKGVIEQRVRTWQADWVRRKRIVEAEGLAESYRLVELARARGQMELVLRIAQALEASQEVSADDAEQIALRLLEVIERLAAEPEVRQQLSGESISALDQAHTKLLKGASGHVAAAS